MKIEKRNVFCKTQLQKNIIKKNNRERTNYMNNLDKYMNERQQELLMKKEKAFQKYQSFVSIIIIFINFITIIFIVFYYEIIE